MKGIILNAGQGKRLLPITACISKGLVPVYDRPALLYHLELFARMGVRELALVVAEQQEQAYARLLAQTDSQGLAIRLFVQKEGVGVLAAYASCVDFAQDSDVMMVMGDCLYFIDDITDLQKQARICFAEDKLGIVQGMARPGASAAFFERQEEGLRYCYRRAGENERCAIGMHFIPRSFTAAPESLGQPSFTEADAAAVSTRLIRCGKLLLPQLGPDDAWFDIGTAEQLFWASAYARERLLRGQLEPRP